MFEQLFERPYALARQHNGPLADERRRYLVHCAEQQMAPQTLRHVAVYTLVVAKALRLADRPGQLVTRSEIESEADRWANRRPRPQKMRQVHYSRLRFTCHANRWLAFLGRLKPPSPAPKPHAEPIGQFADFMLRECGLSPRTVEMRRQVAHDLLVRIDGARLRLDALTVAQVDDLLVRKVRDGGYARVSIKTYASDLRAFFRYAERRVWCRAGLAAGIMAPRVFAHEALPAALSWDDVNRAIAAAQGDRPADIRDRALMMLLAVYGLRASEDVGLRLADFDRQREVLAVANGKGREPQTYPLCRSVGDAVLRYLREARPRSARREVFLTLRAPFRPLPREGLGQAVRRRLHALGVTSTHHGPHALRHACAAHLLAQGLSLKEISDHLGHRSPEATRIYAKVDLAGLRAVADFDLEGLLKNTDELVAHYVAFRRTLGERCKTTEVILSAFCRSVGAKTPVARIDTDAVVAFLAGTGPVTGGWHGRYHALKGFFRFAVSRGHLGQAPLPADVPKEPPRFVPYIYSRADLRRLLGAIRPDRRSRTSIEPPSLRATLLLLYGAGLRASEAPNLTVADVDLPEAVLTVRGTKFFKSRLVPLSPHLTGVLAEYARWRAAGHPSPGDESRFFLGKRGAAISLGAPEGAFQRLRGRAAVHRPAGARYQPRLNDLRHTFAVHRPASWYRQGADVQRLLHLLSVYLGHACLSAIQVYLTMTPELLQQAGARLERYARGEAGHA